MDRELLTEQIIAILDKKKATNIEKIQVTKKTVMADYFIIASGQSTTQVRAISEDLVHDMEEQHGISAKRVEGKENWRWVLIDYGDVIVHIFLAEERDFYQLEKLWS